MSGKRGKNDAADAAAICEAVQRPNMRFIPVKTLDQQSRLMVHRARQGFVAARTATLNRIRGLLSEVGVVLPQKAEVVRREAAQHLEDMPGYANNVIGNPLDGRVGRQCAWSQFGRGAPEAAVKMPSPMKTVAVAYRPKARATLPLPIAGAATPAARTYAVSVQAAMRTKTVPNRTL